MDPAHLADEPNIQPTTRRAKDQSTLALAHRPHLMAPHGVSWPPRYTEDELKSSDTPYGFFYDGGCTNCKQGHMVRDYPVMFDVNFNVSRTAQYLTMLKEGGYLDSMTSELKVITNASPHHEKWLCPLVCPAAIPHFPPFMFPSQFVTVRPRSTPRRR